MLKTEKTWKIDEFEEEVTWNLKVVKEEVTWKGDITKLKRWHEKSTFKALAFAS